MAVSQELQQQHVDHFSKLILEGKTQSDAYREVFPNSLKWKPNSVHTEAAKFRAKPEVEQRIAELRSDHQQRHRLKIDTIVNRLADLGYTGLNSIFTQDENGRLKLRRLDEMPEGAVYAIRDIKLDNAGNVLDLKLADSLKALHLLGQTQGAFSQQLTLTGPNGGPVQTEDVSKKELARWLAFKLSMAAKEGAPA